MLTKNQTDIRSVKEVINKLSKYHKVREASRLDLAVHYLLYYAVFGWDSIMYVCGPYNTVWILNIFQERTVSTWQGEEKGVAIHLIIT